MRNSCGRPPIRGTASFQPPTFNRLPNARRAQSNAPIVASKCAGIFPAPVSPLDRHVKNNGENSHATLLNQTDKYVRKVSTRIRHHVDQLFLIRCAAVASCEVQR
jgi:hypothetical protein